MIISRPQTRSLVSLILFLVVAFALAILNLQAILRDPEPTWFNYLIVAVLTPIAVFITYKVVFRYKVVRMGDGQIDLQYPLFRVQKAYPLKEVQYWTETIVKTGKTATYKELEIGFSDQRKITMAFREYTEYEKMVGYLGQKIPKAKK